MPDVIDRGITVTEVAAADQPINVAAETTAAFVGRALRGPLDTPILIDSFAAFRRRFGGIWQRSSLGPAVQQFFDHGGQQVFVVRISNNALGATIRLPTQSPDVQSTALVLRAVEPGSTEKIRAAVDYDRLADDDASRFNLTVQRVLPESGLVTDQEIFTGVTCESGQRKFIGDTLLTSKLVHLELPLPHTRPQRTAEGYADPAEPGTDGDGLTDYDLIGSATRGTGIFALGEVDRFDILYLPPPGRDRVPGPAAIIAAERYCKKRRALLIVDPPLEWERVEDATNGVREAGYASSSMMIYFPRIISTKNLREKPRTAGGAIAGILCKLDRRYGPWEDPNQRDLGFSREFCPAFDVEIDDAKRLIKDGFNVISGGARRQMYLCGSVTLARDAHVDRESISLGVRRLCLAITSTIELATRWAVFESDAQTVAARLQGQVHAYLCSLADAGALASDKFSVRCDAQLQKSPSATENSINVSLEFRPSGAMEWMSLSLQQSASGCKVSMRFLHRSN